MKLKGQHRFAAPRQEVWEALLDPQVLAGTLPGAEKLERVPSEGDAEHTFAGTLDVRVGPVRGQFDGKVELSDLEPPESYHMDVKGQGPSGFMNGSGGVRLEEDGDGTLLHYDLDAQVGGRIAGVGQRLLDSSARVLTRQALEGLERQLEARGEAAAEPEAAQATGTTSEPEETRGGGGEAEAEPARPSGPRRTESSAAATAGPTPASTATGTASGPSSARFAADFARGLFEELVPEHQRPWVYAGAGGLAVLLLLGLARLLRR